MEAVVTVLHIAFQSYGPLSEVDPLGILFFIIISSHNVIFLIGIWFFSSDGLAQVPFKGGVAAQMV